MSLSDKQIERYSRQIIVPGVGGVAQEHLLAARLGVIGETSDLEPALAYMIGAGIDCVVVRQSANNARTPASLIARLRDLNREVRLEEATAVPDDVTLTLVLVGGSTSLRDARRVCAESTGRAMILARLDPPARIAIFPSPPPCPICADIDLLERLGERGENAGFVAMVALTEAFKILAGVTADSRPCLISIDGYSSATRELRSANAGVCGCAARNAPGVR